MPESDFLRVIGANIRAARVRAGLTQECLAELAELHVQTVSNIERGRYPCSVVVFAQLAQHLGASADSLLSGIPLVDERRSVKIRQALGRRRARKSEN